MGTKGGNTAPVIVPATLGGEQARRLHEFLSCVMGVNFVLLFLSPSIETYNVNGCSV